jgi:PAS domain S-box-containing protein
MIYQFYWYRHQLNHREMESSEALCQTLTSSLEIAMLNKDREAIQHSFQAVTGHAHILRVFLLDTSGTVKAASDRGMVGAQFRKGDEGCRNCHVDQTSDALGTIVTTKGDQVLRVVAPIDNKPLCHSCHGSLARYNGLLVMDRSLEPARSEILSNLRLAGIVAGIAVLLMMLVFRWYIKKQVINRVVYLESLARRVASNELTVDIEVGGRDEIASLARSVANMKTALKTSIDQIANHRNYLANLLENLVDGILILDDGVVVFVNRAMSGILGVDSSVLQIGKRLAFERDPLDRVAQIDSMIASLQDTGQSVKEAMTLRDSGQEEKHLEVHVGQLVLPPRHKPEVIIVIRDITTRVTAENQVYQSERLATVGRLAAGIAHEINNPMASILTCTEGLLRDQGSWDEGRREYLQVIKNSAQRCRMITQKLLDYSAASAPTMDPVDLGDVLQESVSLLQFEAGKRHVALTVEKAVKLPVIAGAKDSLVQVFVNLILNSIQAAEKGGQIQVVATENNSAVDVFVIDDGPGIAAANLPRIFDPFFTTKPVGMGTGLGLSVSQGIVKHHGGTIDVVESQKGRTSIRVSLPILRGGAEPK